MKKYFKTNKDYFKFYNLNKNKIEIQALKFVKSRKVSLVKYKYCLIYENKL